MTLKEFINENNNLKNDLKYLEKQNKDYDMKLILMHSEVQKVVHQDKNDQNLIDELRNELIQTTKHISEMKNENEALRSQREQKDD